MLTLVRDCELKPIFIVSNLDPKVVKGICDQVSGAVCSWWNQEPQPPNDEGQAEFVAVALGLVFRPVNLEQVFMRMIANEGGTIADFALADVEI